VHDDPLDPVLVRRVSAFVDRMDARIVISSAWRHYHTVHQLQEKLRRKGFQHPQRIIDVTPEPFGVHALKDRGREIDRWLKQYQGTVERFAEGSLRYAILDDMPASHFQPVAHRLVQTDARTGVTDADIRRAMKLLSQPTHKVLAS